MVVMSVPWRWIRPRQPTKPDTASSRVVLPAPFGPMMPTISEALTTRSTPSTARRPPKSTVTDDTSSTGSSADIGRDHLTPCSRTHPLRRPDQPVWAAGHHHDEADADGERGPVADGPRAAEQLRRLDEKERPDHRAERAADATDGGHAERGQGQDQQRERRSGERAEEVFY